MRSVEQKKFSRTPLTNFRERKKERERKREWRASLAKNHRLTNNSAHLFFPAHNFLSYTEILINGSFLSYTEILFSKELRLLPPPPWLLYYREPENLQYFDGPLFLRLSKTVSYHFFFSIFMWQIFLISSLQFVDARPNDHKVTDLYGTEDFRTKYKQYSGYFRVSNDHFLHYWQVFKFTTVFDSKHFFSAPESTIHFKGDER